MCHKVKKTGCDQNHWTSVGPYPVMFLIFSPHHPHHRPPPQGKPQTLVFLYWFAIAPKQSIVRFAAWELIQSFLNYLLISCTVVPWEFQFIWFIHCHCFYRLPIYSQQFIFPSYFWWVHGFQHFTIADSAAVKNILLCLIFSGVNFLSRFSRL